MSYARAEADLAEDGGMRDTSDSWDVQRRDALPHDVVRASRTAAFSHGAPTVGTEDHHRSATGSYGALVMSLCRFGDAPAPEMCGIGGSWRGHTRAGRIVNLFHIHPTAATTHGLTIGNLTRE
ncbi:hypothetical protein GCM10010344_44320 [Streptomyces bluensis]|nr:hypothetical protein GCM10010344_44320 [Streptomyces bluensis]